MRHVLMISAAALALTACQKAGDGKTAAAPAAAAPAPSGGPLSLTSLPTRKAGLWQQAMSQDGAATPMGAMKICVDAASDAKMSLLGERMKSDKDCQKSFSRGLDGSFSYSSTCKMGQAGVISSKGVITGDFASSYTVKAENDITGSAVARMNGHHVMEIQSTYLGPCPAGMSGGDISLANGMTFNAAKMAAMAGGGPPKP
jgi:hypothetical protein